MNNVPRKFWRCFFQYHFDRITDGIQVILDCFVYHGRIDFHLNGKPAENIGADTTEISVISLGGLVLSDLLHFGGRRIDESIINHMKRNFGLVVGEKTAMYLKETLGCAIPEAEQYSEVIVGRDVVSL